MPPEIPPEQPVPTDLLADVLWKRVDHPSFEHCRVLSAAKFISVHGCVLAAAEGIPLRVDYLVFCATDWTTRTVNVHVTHGLDHRVLEIRRDDDGVWWREGAAIPDMEGVVDVDLAITPSTNTLPIRRLALPLGAEVKLDALWVQFPSFTIERLSQSYTSTGDRRYLYQSRGGAFSAELEVDHEGVVIRYGTIWERVAPS